MAQDNLKFATGSGHSASNPMLLAVQDSSNKTLRECLGLLLADERLLAEVAHRSYRHQLGFWKCVLKTDDSGQSLRLHFWDRVTTPTEDIHSHCASFHSRLVFGSLVESSFAAIGGETHMRFRYGFNSVTGHGAAAADGLSAVRLKGRRVLSRGDSYSKFAADLHSVSNVEKGTITISYWGVRDSYAVVLKAPEAVAEDCLASVGISPIELASILKEIMERLDS